MLVGLYHFHVPIQLLAAFFIHIFAIGTNVCNNILLQYVFIF